MRPGPVISGTGRALLGRLVGRISHSQPPLRTAAAKVARLEWRHRLHLSRLEPAEVVEEGLGAASAAT
jgi:hypothetical protein